MKLRWTRFQILSLASALGAFALVVAGGFVTQTNSGLGCPDWPLCGGSIVPDWGNPTMVTEWTHRTVAAVVGILVLLTTILAWRDRRDDRRIVFVATMSLVLVAIQATLGGVVVLSELNAGLIVVHLAFAAAFFAMAVATAILAFVLPPLRPAETVEAPERAGVAEEKTQA